MTAHLDQPPALKRDPDLLTAFPDIGDLTANQLLAQLTGITLCDTALRTCAERLTQRGLCKLDSLVAGMRKWLPLIFGILKSGQPFDPHFLDRAPANA